ncbi:MAG: polysaccharide biosynthesis/export family protein [Gemmatimonadaceae bacterium]
MRKTHRVRHGVGLLLVAVAFVSARAQSSLGELRRQMTRAELQTALASYEKLAVSTNDKKVKEHAMGDAAAIRDRLRTGDFYPGDRILVRVLNDTTVSDTFTVKQGRVIDFITIPQLSLSGVLDSELLAHVKQHIAKYIRDPDVTVTPLVRLQLSGGIAQPGWYQFETDQTLSDAIMSVGGPGQNSELSKAVIKRGSQVLVDRGATARALRSGKTIGDLGLRDGDELFIADRPVAGGNRWLTVLPIVSALLLTIRLISITRR